MRTYAVVENGVVTNTIVADDGFVGDDPRYIASSEAGIGWTWDGAKFIPPEIVRSPVPSLVIVVSPYQARVALLNAGLLDTIETAINAKGGAVKIKWEYATEVRSDDADLLELATELGIAAQIPALFAAAQQIT